MLSNESGRACPVAIGTPDPGVAEKTLRKHRAREAKIHRDRRRKSFVTWAHGYLGLGRRYELSSCVSAAIMQAYPSQHGHYVGLTRSTARETQLECDDEEWKVDDF
ncbi:hypothetical protein OSTOST_13314 [Ostertagia ostertagi]